MRAAILSLTAIALAGAATLVEKAPAKARALANPLANDSTAAAAGRKLYERECASCHGDKLQGTGKRPALNTPWMRDAQPGAIFWVITNGAVFHGMPSFAHLPKDQRWQIVSFVQRELHGDDHLGQVK